MSGTFGYDGYIYQTNVALYLLLEKIASGSGLEKIVLEARKVNQDDRRKHDFTVDLLLYYSKNSEDKRCDIVEVKGGRQSEVKLDEILKNLDECEAHILSEGTFLITQKIVLRKQEQDLSFGKGVVQLLSDEILPSEDCFSELETKTIRLIKIILKEFLSSNDYDYYPRLVFYSLRHSVEFEIKKLADKILNDDTIEVESCEISLDKIFNHNESFVDAIMNGGKLSTRTAAFDYLQSINNGGSNRPVPKTLTANSAQESL